MGKIKTKSISEEDIQEPTNFQELGNLYFDRRITQAIISQLGLKSPTLVQSKMIPIALKGRDVLVKARTGSGKTLGYAIPIIHSLLTKIEKENKPGFLKSIIIVPTKELAEQVYGVIKLLLFYCGDIISVERSTTILKSDLLNIHNLPTILVSTPTSLLTILSFFNNLSGRSDSSFDLRNTIESIVIDEADLMNSFGFSSSMQKIGQMLPSASSRHYQAILCSATLTDDVQQLKSLILYKPFILKLETNQSEDPSVIPHMDGFIHQYYHVADKEADKFLIIYTLIALNLIPNRALIFTNTVDGAYRLMIFLERFSILSAVLNTSMPFSNRHTIIQEFNQHVLNILIATDDAIQEQSTSSQKQSSPSKDYVAIHRGLDLQDVPVVINFDTPLTEESYIHRVGRTGRGGLDGTAITFASKEHQENFLLSLLLNSENIKHINASSTTDDSMDNTLKVYPIEKNGLKTFSYRVSTTLSSITKKTIEDTKLRILKREALHNTRLRAHFEENPSDLLVLKKSLRNSKSTHTNNAQLSHIPSYLHDSASQLKQTAIQIAIKQNTLTHFPTSSQNLRLTYKNKKNNNPLNTFEVDKKFQKTNKRTNKLKNGIYTSQAQLNKLIKHNDQGTNPSLEHLPIFSGRKLWKLRHNKKLNKGGIPGNYLKKR